MWWRRSREGTLGAGRVSARSLWWLRLSREFSSISSKSRTASCRASLASKLELELRPELEWDVVLMTSGGGDISGVLHRLGGGGGGVRSRSDWDLRAIEDVSCFRVSIFLGSSMISSLVCES